MRTSHEIVLALLLIGTVLALVGGFYLLKFLAIRQIREAKNTIYLVAVITKDKVPATAIEVDGKYIASDSAQSRLWLSQDIHNAQLWSSNGPLHQIVFNLMSQDPLRNMPQFKYIKQKSGQPIQL